MTLLSAAKRVPARIATLTGALALTALAILGGALATSAPAQAAEYKDYVALGDSYVSGPGVPDQLPSTECARSTNNYANVVAKEILSNEQDRFIDASCGGAKTIDMTQPQQSDGKEINLPQLDALTANTDLVTIGIGGNDIGFGDIVKTCVGLAMQGKDCTTHYTTGGDQLAKKIDETGPKVADVLKEIRNRSPKADILVVGYPTILGDAGCFPNVPIAEADVPYLRDVVVGGLNKMLEKAAKDNDATYVDVATPTKGHDICQPADVRFIEPITGGPGSVHPNKAGFAAVGEVIIAELSDKPTPTPTPSATSEPSKTATPSAPGEGAEKPLPNTGAAVGATIAIGAALLAGGIAVTLVTRRRKLG